MLICGTTCDNQTTFVDSDNRIAFKTLKQFVFIVAFVLLITASSGGLFGILLFR